MVKSKNSSNQKVRTKGNIKPSSSDRASEFLQRNVFPGTGIVSNLGFHSGPITTSAPQPNSGGFSSLLPLDQDIAAASIDADILATLRRLEKRNSATKQKALDTLKSLLCDQIANSEYLKSEDVIAASVLPFWPRLYSSLAFDDDRRVRELSQVVMHELAKRLGRRLAPFLKEIVVSWTFGTVDISENAARAAQVGLNDTFPGNRLGELYRTYATYLLDECENRLECVITELPNRLKFKRNRLPEDPLPPEAHHHLSIVTQFLAWVTSLLTELCKLPADNSQLSRLHDIIQRLCPTISPVLNKVKFAPLSIAYFRFISTMCKCMTEWVIEQNSLFEFVVHKCVSEIDASPERLDAASTCLSVLGQKVWVKISWMDFVCNTIIPMIDQAQTKVHRQVIRTNVFSSFAFKPALSSYQFSLVVILEVLITCRG